VVATMRSSVQNGLPALCVDPGVPIHPAVE
jgi:hypothetical protein